MKTLGFCVAAGLLLSACASGISSEMTINTNSNKIVTQYPVEAALLNIYTRAYSDRLYTLIDDQLFVVDTQITPKGVMDFDNKQVQGAEAVATTIVNDQVVDKSVSINYFTLDPLVFHGFTSDADEYSIATQTQPIPKIASINESSTYLTEQVYSDSSKRKHLKTYTQTWSLKRESNDTAWFCIESSENLLLSDDNDGPATECYKINAQGDILASKITIRQTNEDGSTEATTFVSQ